jgi:hypothetical protein
MLARPIACCYRQRAWIEVAACHHDPLALDGIIFDELAPRPAARLKKPNICGSLMKLNGTDAQDVICAVCSSTNIMIYPMFDVTDLHLNAP